MIVLGLDLCVMGIHEDGKMVGHWVREKSGKYPDGKDRLAARGLVARRQRNGREAAGGSVVR